MRKPLAFCMLVVALFAVPALAQQAPPTGAVARCGNGWFVFVPTGANTCVGYGGVAEWLTAAPTVTAAPATAVTSVSPAPVGAVARCGNGWYVFVSTGANTCAGYGGVAEWLAGGGSALVFQPTPTTSVRASSAPTGAVARCGNGWYVFASTGPRTCEGYGSVAEWLVDPRTAPAANLARPTRATSRVADLLATGRTPIAPRPRSAYPSYFATPSAVQNSSTNAVSATASQIGPFTYYNDSSGVSGTSTKIGPFTYYNDSNGVSGTSNRIGEFTYYNFNKNGDSTTGTSTAIGQFQFHNFSNGVTGTSNQVGGFTFHTFSNGTHCTTNQIGTFVYTNCY